MIYGEVFVSYLECALSLFEEDLEIRNKNISSSLNVSKATVAIKLKSMIEDKYLEYINGKRLKLTDKGLDLAKKIRKLKIIFSNLFIEKFNISNALANTMALGLIGSINLEEVFEKLISKC